MQISLFIEHFYYNIVAYFITNGIINIPNNFYHGLLDLL